MKRTEPSLKNSKKKLTGNPGNPTSPFFPFNPGVPAGP